MCSCTCTCFSVEGTSGRGQRWEEANLQNYQLKFFPRKVFWKALPSLITTILRRKKIFSQKGKIISNFLIGIILAFYNSKHIIHIYEFYCESAKTVISQHLWVTGLKNGETKLTLIRKSECLQNKSEYNFTWLVTNYHCTSLNRGLTRIGEWSSPNGLPKWPAVTEKVVGT